MAFTFRTDGNAKLKGCRPPRRTVSRLRVLERLGSLSSALGVHVFSFVGVGDLARVMSVSFVVAAQPAEPIDGVAGHGNLCGRVW